MLLEEEKKSIAKVWVKKGSGNIHVNGLKMNDYFKRPVHQIIVTRPLEISQVSKNYDVKCSVKGGGLIWSSWSNNIRNFKSTNFTR